jgi:hypothetical protein
VQPVHYRPLTVRHAHVTCTLSTRPFMQLRSSAQRQSDTSQGMSSLPATNALPAHASTHDMNTRYSQQQTSPPATRLAAAYQISPPTGTVEVLSAAGAGLTLNPPQRFSIVASQPNASQQSNCGHCHPRAGLHTTMHA